MKNIILFAVFTATIFNIYAEDLIDGDFEYNNWQSDYSINNTEVKNKDHSYFGKASVEIKSTPAFNFHYAFSNANYDNYKYIQDNLTYYYKLYNENNLSVDFGGGITKITNGNLFNDEFDGYLGHLYTGTELNFSESNMILFSNVRISQSRGIKITDFILGSRYDFNIMKTKLGLQAGYKYQNLTMDNFDNITSKLISDGIFLGFNFNY